MTFIDNHDTGSTQQHWPFPADLVGAGYAYILTHPGIPCIFWDHYFTWGAELHNIIHTLVDVSMFTLRLMEHLYAGDVYQQAMHAVNAHKSLGYSAAAQQQGRKED